MKLGAAVKTYADRLDYDFLYYRWLTDEDRLMDVKAVITGLDKVVVESVSWEADRAKVWLSGGAAGVAQKEPAATAPDTGTEILVLSPATGAFVGEDEKIATFNGGDHTLAASYTFKTPTEKKVYLDENNTEHVSLSTNGVVPMIVGDLTVIAKTKLGRTKEVCIQVRVKG